MMEILRHDERGHARSSWLDSHHSFSFGSYHNPDRMGFGPLRVINEDRVDPGQGFGAHGHRDMEIISYVLDGVLEHEDSLGHAARIEAGTFQRMTAGTGVVHSERNASPTAPVHFLQIWIEPGQRDLKPGYAEFRPTDDALPMLLVGSGREPAPLEIHQDASLYRIRLDAGESLTLELEPERRGWLHVVTGQARIGSDISLAAGDAAGFAGEAVPLTAESASEALFFDLP